jgi:hypothetical protein
VTLIVRIAMTAIALALVWEHANPAARVLIILLLIGGRLAYAHVRPFRGDEKNMTRRPEAWFTHKLALALRQALAEWKERR